MSVYPTTMMRAVAALLAVACLTLGVTAADAQGATVTTATQTLDRVTAFTTGTALDMATGNAQRPPDFTNLGTTGTAFSTCTMAPTSGFYCLDGKQVRRWPNPADPSVVSTLVWCDDTTLGLDTRKSDGCTALTVDLSGTLWIAGRKSNSHSVIKIVAPVNGSCPTGFSALVKTAYCAREFYSGRPALVDLISIDGDAATSFRACPTCTAQPGLLGIEERKNAVFFPTPASGLPTQPVTAVGSKDWALSGDELQDVTILQTSADATPATVVLASTSSGRVLAKNPAFAGAARAVFSAPTAIAPTLQPCASLVQQYGLRSSPMSGIVYLSDRNYCQVTALVATGSPFVLTKLQGDGAVLSTRAAPGPYPLVGLTIAPGITLDLRDCSLRCAVVNNALGQSAASLDTLKLQTGSASGATVFQVKGVPDCRYAYASGFPSAQKALCIATPDVVVLPSGASTSLGADGRVPGFPAAALRLNVTPLLPMDATAAFRSTGLPPLLISRQYRGQSRNGYLFQALFVVPQAGVRYRDVFGGEFDVAGLENLPASLGCSTDPARLLAWDVSTTVSELYVSVGGKYVDTLTNVGCGSIKISGARLSLLPYDLEVAPDTYDASTGAVTFANDAVFGRLLQTLYGDLGLAQRELACLQVDPSPAGGTPPLSASLCNTLTSGWTNGKLKLDKCVSAAFFPKQSGGDENCQAFLTALRNYESALPATTPAQDVANRVGELKMRIRVIRHVYDTRFAPSIPAGGFCRENGCSL